MTSSLTFTSFVCIDPRIWVVVVVVVVVEVVSWACASLAINTAAEAIEEGVSWLMFAFELKMTNRGFVFYI